MKNILIVDDQPENLQTIAEFLADSKLPYEIMKAPDGLVALKVIENDVPDLIITDWEMPLMDGIDFIKQLRTKRHSANIPVIMCTGVMTTSEHLQIALKAGATDYIRKPVDPIELIARTQSILKITELQNEIIEHKNRELAENSMNLVQNNQYFEKLVKKLQSLDKQIKEEQETDSLLNSMITDLNSQFKEESWNRFNIYFQKVYPAFQKELIACFSDISASELRLCTFLRMGMNTKDIAAALSQSIGTVKGSRFKLREKFILKKKESLTVFLTEF
jgi:response regulator RpfG family c-di-GMP phosphodiesterase